MMNVILLCRKINASKGLFIMDYPVLDKIEVDSIDYISSYMNQDASLQGRQLLLLDGLRILDRLFMDLHTGNVDKDSKAHMADTITYGYPTLLKQAFCSFDGQLNAYIHPLTKEGIETTEGFIYSCGLYGMAQNFRELISKERLYLVKSEEKHLQLAYKDKYSHVDAVEQFYLTLYADMIKAHQREKYNALMAQQKNIIKQMSELVYVWRDFYIGYSTNQEIDDYFLSNAELDTSQAIEWRAFPRECTFGGIKYETYINTLVYLISFAIKHMQYCILLTEKHPEIILENLITIITANEDTIKLIMNINSISWEDASKVFSALSLNSRNTDQHIDVRSAPPPLISISDHRCIRSICGCMERPFEFLLDNLKYMYPREWDANASRREAEFREDLYAFFDPDRFISLHRNIEIGKNGRMLTDIDACIIDKVTGEIGFFQLKWQDLVYAKNSLSLSKKRNFKDKTNQWISTIREWLSTISEKQIADHLGINKKFVDKQKIKLFVLGRHNCNFADETPPDSLVAWGQWYQVIVLFQQIPHGDRTIGTLFNILQTRNPFNRRVFRIQNRYKIGDLIIETEGIQSPYLVFERK